jgi:hypothetical protein
MTKARFKMILGKFVKEFLMVTSATAMLTVTLRSSVYLTNNGPSSLPASSWEHLMKDALTTLSAPSLITAGSPQRKMPVRRTILVTPHASACLSSLRIMKRSLDGSTLLDILIYRTWGKTEGSASLGLLLFKLLSTEIVARHPCPSPTRPSALSLRILLRLKASVNWTPKPAQSTNQS